MAVSGAAPYTATMTRNQPLFWLGLVLALTGVVHVSKIGRQAVGRDFYQVWLPALAQKDPRGVDLYSVEDRQALGRYAMTFIDDPGVSPALRSAILYCDKTYPHHLAGNFTPAMLLAHLPFVDQDYDASLAAFNAVSLAMVLLGLVLLARVAGLSETSTLLVMAALLWWFLPLRNDTIDSNVNRLQLGVVGLSLWLSHRWQHGGVQFAAAALIGALVMFKPNLALLPVLLLAAPMSVQHWRRVGVQLGGNVLGAAAMLVAPIWRFGDKATWSNWLANIKQVHQNVYAIEDGNIATARLIMEITGMNLSVLLVTLLTVLAIALIAVASKRGRDTRLFAAGAAPLIAIVSSQLAWPHYALLLAPLIIAVAAKPRIGAGAVLAISYIIIAEDLLRDAVILMTNMQHGWLLAAAMLALAGVVARDLMRPSPAP